jgi:hypothetical protein
MIQLFCFAFRVPLCPLWLKVSVFAFPITAITRDVGDSGDLRDFPIPRCPDQPMEHLPQFDHFQRTFLPVMFPANNPVAAIHPVPVPQKIPALKFKLQLHPL